VTLLHGCNSLDEHDEVIRQAVSAAARRALDGHERLGVLGFEFRFVPCCSDHSSVAGCKRSGIDTDICEHQQFSYLPRIAKCEEASNIIFQQSNSRIPPIGRTNMNEKDRCSTFHCNQCATRLFYVGRESKTNASNGYELDSCQSPTTLPENEHHHKQQQEQQPVSSTNDTAINHDSVAIMITPDNRQQFIADGAMYESIATLAQRAAQEWMLQNFNLDWITVCNESHSGERVCALVDRDHPLLLDNYSNERTSSQIASPKSMRTITKPILLVLTGRGKVRAGIFSRHHLLTAGIEVGTSWHCIREARSRKWGVAIIDPNACGEERGYEIFRRSVCHLFGYDLQLVNEDESPASMDNGHTGSLHSSASKQTAEESTCPSTMSSSSQSPPLFVLAHSASGGHLVRHLREDPSLLSSIRAIAFTDSTHNVQWCKHNPTLLKFLQQNNCVYLRSNNVRSSQSCVRVSSRGKDIWCNCVPCNTNKKNAGVEADTDGFWKHRFGSVKTYWAGTADHSLTNWFGHANIWDHFDKHAAAVI
jgi:hypothetical protein